MSDDEKKAVALRDPNQYIPPAAMAAPTINERALELRDQDIGYLADATILPPKYINNYGNILIAYQVAAELGKPVITVMQNMHFIDGRPSWSSTFIMALIKGCGRYEAIEYVTVGEEPQRGKVISDTYGCYVSAVEIATGKTVKGPTVDIKMAKAEGWFGRRGSKWQTMPEVMVQYRAAAFFGRLHIPDILLGFSADDEIVDVSPRSGRNPRIAALDRATALSASTNESENADT